MDKKKFEHNMEVFFDKAGVTLLVKGSEYKGGEETASYILLDIKRKSFYLAETDILDKNDTELDEITSYFIENDKITEAAAKVILRLGRAGLFFDDDLEVEGHNLTPMIRKSAFVISETNAEAISEFLKSRSISFQAVPSNGKFLVLFLDRSNSKKIAALYHKVSDAFLKSSLDAHIEPGGQATQLIDEIDRTIRENKILFDIDKDETDVLIHKSIQKEAAENNFDPLAEAIALSVSEKEDTESVDTSSIFNEIIENDKTKSTIESASSGKNLSYESGSSKSFSKKVSESEEGQKTPPVAVKPPEGAVKHISKDENTTNKTAMIYKILFNVSACVFFLPVYILNKVTFKKVPPFVIYWVSSICIFFGLYQLILSFMGGSYSQSVTAANDVALYASGLFDFTKDVTSFEGAAGNIMMTSLVYFIGEISFYDFLKEYFILKYLLAFFSVIMIFPFTRNLGAKLSIFCILFYVFLPFILFIQADIIKAASDGTLNIVKSVLDSGNTALILGVVSAATAFAVYMVPIISAVVLYTTAGFISPYKNNNKNFEVLP